MKAWAWLAAGTCLYAVSLLALAPARLLDARLDETSNGHLRLASSEGTLWSGNGLAELRDQTGSRRWAAPLSWRLRPAALLAGRLDFELATDPPVSVSAMSVSRSKIGFSGVDIRLPAATLAAGLPDMAGWGVAGLRPGLSLAPVRGQADWIDGDVTVHPMAWGGYAVPTGSGLLFGRITYDMMSSFWPTPAAAQMMPDVAASMNAPLWNESSPMK